MFRCAFLLILSLSAAAQTLPKHDNGIFLSGNISNRHIPDYPLQTPVKYLNVDFRKNWNYQNRSSFKSGASLFVVGNKFEYHTARKDEAASLYGYLRVPGLYSYNFDRFYVDLGGAPCLRLFHSDFSQRGGGNDRGIAFTFTLESHLGYYYPLGKRRLFTEFGAYLSEVNSYVYLPVGAYSANFTNDYTLNFQIGIGIMFNKSEE